MIGRTGRNSNPWPPEKTGELTAFGSIERLSTPNEHIKSNSAYFGGPGRIRTRGAGVRSPVPYPCSKYALHRTNNAYFPSGWSSHR
jgi:hypothetical protein